MILARPVEDLGIVKIAIGCRIELYYINVHCIVNMPAVGTVNLVAPIGVAMTHELCGILHRLQCRALGSGSVIV